MSEAWIAVIGSIATILISSLVSMWLWNQKEKKEKPQDDINVAEKTASTMDVVIENLREELERQKKLRIEKEKEFLSQIDRLKSEIDTNAQYFQDLLEKQRSLHLQIVNELREEIDQVHKENKELKDAKDALTRIVNAQALQMQAWKEQNETFKRELMKLKKDTGELKNNGKKR